MNRENPENEKRNFSLAVACVFAWLLIEMLLGVAWKVVAHGSH